MTELVAGPESSGRRLDLVLSDRLGLSRSQVQRTLQQKLVSVNGRAERASYAVKPGDRIVITGRESPAMATAEPLPILYQDDDLLVVDKPAGMLSHPGAGRPESTVVEAVRNLVADDDPSRPGIVHRLDRDTSGVLVVARHPKSKAYLQNLFKQRQITKTYLALAVGHPDPPEAIIDLPLGRSEADRTLRSVRGDGRTSTTSYRVLEELPGYALLEVEPLTGRTHQIRAHLRAIGHPIAGDARYGAPKGPRGLRRQFLHAYRLQLQGPNGQAVDVRSPLPEDLSRVLAELGSTRLPTI